MGPLAGVKIVEFTGIGPAPMAAMLLADMGATVLRIDRVAAADLGMPMAEHYEFTRRSRAVLHLDLKQPAAIAAALKLIDGADALIEGFRPGVMERLGLGPEVCLRRNPRLAYGRVTGWGQEGPLSQAAGHDLNYIALTGALHAIGRAGQKPTPPLNLVGDYGGGALYLVTGLLAAIISARSTGAGQVVDAAMVDGALSLMTPIYAMLAGGRMPGARGENQLDSGSYYYEVYECADGQFISIAPIEVEVSRRIAAPAGDRSGRHAGPARQIRLAALEGSADRALSDPHARRLVPYSGGNRRLLRARAVDGGSACASAQPGARRFHRCRRPAPARARASLRYDDTGDATATGIRAAGGGIGGMEPVAGRTRGGDRKLTRTAIVKL